MATESLALMTIDELRYERQLSKVQLVQIKVSMRGAPLRTRMELEEAAEETQRYIDSIEARIARLERKTRTQP
jgi:hypothetical protein